MDAKILQHLAARRPTATASSQAMPNDQDNSPGSRGSGGSPPLTKPATAKLPAQSILGEGEHRPLAGNDQGGEPGFDINGLGVEALKAIFGDEAMPLELDEDDEINMAQRTAIKVALDSGAADHVLNPEQVPGHAVKPSKGSQAGKHFLAAGGHRIENQGEINVVVSGDDFTRKVRSTFQAAAVTRPLMSVSKICDSGCIALFDKTKAIIKKDGKVVGTFKRQGGLYVADLTVEDPGEGSGFTGPGQQR
jgi:hypothetical protein